MGNGIKWWMFEMNGKTFGPTISGSEVELKERMLRLTGKTPENVREATQQEIEKKIGGEFK